MAVVAKRYQDELKNLKSKVEMSRGYFRDNYERFDNFRKFVFDTALTDNDKALLQTRNMPQLEFNISEAYISRLRGEFSKQEPSVVVRAMDGNDVHANVIDLVKGHFRAILFEANSNSFLYNIYTDILSGGFSAFEVATEYANPKSFDQIITFKHICDPTLVGFDPLATLPHKGDGSYCFKIYPKRKKEFKEEYPNASIEDVSFTRDIEGFNWSYKNQNEEILLVCEYYVKKKKRTKIVQLVNDKSMTESEYNDFLEWWDKNMMMGVPPAVKNQKFENIETICRYIFIENQVIEFEETDFKYLPYVFVDGNSINIREGTNGSTKQMTRPYVYHLRGTQRLKNFAGQTLANFIENIIMHKWIAAKEGIPPEYQDAYINPQMASTIVYNAYRPDDPDKPVPAPREVAAVPMPPEVTSAFTLTDQMTQLILGSYDSSLGINNNQLSGIAVVESATQSNAAAMPYVVRIMQSLTQGAKIAVDLIPKYFKTPRTIPIVDKEGKKTYVEINKTPETRLDYKENALDITVEAGVNFAIQKSRALQSIIAMMQSSKIFDAFMNEKGLEILVDNLEVEGGENLKMLAKQFMMEMQQKQAQAMQMQQAQAQNNPLVMKQKQAQQEIALKAEKQLDDSALERAKLELQQQQLDIERARLTMALRQAHEDNLIALDKHNAEKQRAAVDLAIKESEHAHNINKDVVELQHKILTSMNKPEKAEREESE